MDTSKGYISFTDEGYETVLRTQQAYATVAQEQYLQAQVDKIEFERQQYEKSAARAAISFSSLQFPQEFTVHNYVDGFEMPTTDMLTEQLRPTFNDTTRKTILNMFAGNEDLLYDKSDSSTKKIIELLKKNNIDITSATQESQYAFIDDLRSNAGEIARYTSSIDEYTEKIAAYTRALINTEDKPETSTDYEYWGAYQKYKAEELSEHQ